MANPLATLGDTATFIPPAAPRRRMPGWATAVIGIVAVFVLLTITSILDDQPLLTSSGIISKTIIFAMPIMLVGLGGIWSERSGSINIGLEGMMILGTWGAAWGGYHWGPVGALVTAAVFGALGGLLHAVATVTFGVNHIVSGVAINLLGAGIARYLSTLLFEPITNNARDSPQISRFDSFPLLPEGMSDSLQQLERDEVPVLSNLAGVVRGFLGEVSPLLIISVVLLVGSYFLLWRSPFGLRLRSCGENPVAAESLGINVYRYKYIAIAVSGALAGLGGAVLVLGSQVAAYTEGQTGGRGFIGLAAMIFGNWRPGGMLAGAGLFGYADTLQLTGTPEAVHALLYGAAIAAGLAALWQLYRRKLTTAIGLAAAAVAVYALYYVTDELPEELVTYTPHIVTLIVLAFAAQRLRPPAANGVPYRRGEGD
jgi:general nucleoside transport system permease protein